MDANRLLRQGHRLLQIGVALIAALALEGFVIPFFPVPRLGLSVHTLATFEGLIFLTFGLIWPRLALGRTAATIAWWTFVYSAFATMAAYVLAAAWGAGGTTIPLAAGGAVGSPWQEMTIRFVLASSAPTFLIAIAIIIFGLRVPRESALLARHDPLAGTARRSSNRTDRWVLFGRGEPRFRGTALASPRRAPQQHGRVRVQARRPPADFSWSTSRTRSKRSTLKWSHNAHNSPASCA